MNFAFEGCPKRMKTNAEVEKIFAEARDAALKFLGARQRTLRETEKRLEEKIIPPKRFRA